MSFDDAKEISFNDEKEISLKEISFFNDEKEISLKEISFSMSFEDAKEISFNDEKEISLKEISFSVFFEDAKEISFNDEKETPPPRRKRRGSPSCPWRSSHSLAAFSRSIRSSYSSRVEGPSIDHPDERARTDAADHARYIR